MESDSGSCSHCARSNTADSNEGHLYRDRSIITWVLLTINLAVFLLMVWKRVSLISPTSDQIVRWGGNFGPLTLGSQPWRLITNLFVHIGLPHLAANMWALFILGRFAESLYGRGSYLIVYLLSGVAGSLASLLWNPMGVSAGASGALFGLAGALIATLFAGKLPFPRHVARPILWTLVAWAAFALGYGFWNARADNAAHVGGLTTGLIVGYLLGHHLGEQAAARRSRKYVLAVALTAITLFGFVVSSLSSYVVQVERARRLLAEGKPDEALTMLQPVAQKRPREAYVHVLIANAHEQRNEFEQSERELRVALQFAPKNPVIWQDLGDIYLKLLRWQDAADAFVQGAAFSKDSGVFWFNAGLCYRQLDRPQDAVDAFRKAVNASPAFGQAWYQLGMSLLNIKQNEEAVNALQSAVKLLPNSPEAHLWLGNALLATGQEQQANMEFSKAYRLHSSQTRALRQLKQQNSVGPNRAPAQR